MGSTLVIDASVVIDSLLLEGDPKPSTRLLRALGWPDPITLMAPDLIFLETGNALRKLAHRGAISKRNATRGVQLLSTLPIASVGCSTLLDGAWSLRGSFSTYDAAYLSLARDLALPFVTADTRLRRGAARAGVHCWHVSDPQLRKLLDAWEPASSDAG